MDAHLFSLFSDIAVPLLNNALIEKIQEPAKNFLTISVYTNNQKLQLVLHYGKQNPFIYFSQLKFPVKGDPPAPIMRIRRYFNQKRIIAVVNQNFQRRLWLLTANNLHNDKIVWLCLDLIAGPSLHFLNPNETPQVDRPVWPASDTLTEAMEDWRNWPVLTPSLRKRLLQMEPLDQYSLILDLEKGSGDLFIYRDPENGNIRKISAWPLNQKDSKPLIEESSADIYSALQKSGDDLVAAKFFEKSLNNLIDRNKKKRNHLQKLLGNINHDEIRLQAMVEQSKDALLLQANIWRWVSNLKTDHVTVPEREESILLDRRFTVRENMERFFKNAKRGQRGLKLLTERRSAILKELNEINIDTDLETSPQAAQNTKKQIKAAIASLPKNVATYLSSDGFLLLRGKDAQGNRAIRRLLSPQDLWVHVEQGPGTHVAIRKDHPNQEIPERTLTEAGALAAAKSWLSNSDKASIMYAEARHVKSLRSKNPGQVSIDKIAFTRLVDLNPDIELLLANS